ncbi:MAG: hypothetical protein L0Y44_03500 [Phycisphaerales bacterium]|nr:hypothetical protein [Phycisphaerales bacterium]
MTCCDRLRPAALLLAGALCSTVPAQPHPGFKVLDVVVDKPVFDSVCDALSIDETRRAKILADYEAYWASVQELDRASYSRVLDAGLREIELHASSPRSPNAPVEWNQRHDELSYQYTRVMASAKLQGDQLLTQWLAGIDEKLQLDDNAVDVASRLVRRMNLLSCNEEAEDFNAKLDLRILFERALDDEAEFAVLRTVSLGSPNTLIEARVDLMSILQDWEIAIDAVLLDRLAEGRHLRPFHKKITLGPDDNEYDNLIRAWAARFGRSYDVFTAHADGIAVAAEIALGAAAADAWRDRVHRALCPQLAKPRLPEQTFEQLKKLPDLTSEQLLAAESLHAQYSAQQRNAVARAIDAGSRLKRMQFIAQPDHPTRVEEIFAESLYDIHALSKRTVRAFLGLLLPDQATALQKHLGKPASPGAYGPQINRNMLNRLNLRTDYENLELSSKNG